MGPHLRQWGSRDGNQDLDSPPGWTTSLDASLEIPETQLVAVFV